MNMRNIFLSILFTTFLSFVTLAQDATTPKPTATPTNSALLSDSPLNQEFEKLKTEQKELLEAQRKLQQSLGNLTANREEKSSQIAILQEKFNLLQQQYQSLAAVNKQRDEKSVEVLKLQYRKTLEAYKRIFSQAAGISNALKLSNTISSLQSETNPIRNNGFRNQLSELQGELDEKNKFFGESSFLSNPYVSIALNLASLFVSKFDKNGRIKKMKNLVCVLDVSIRTAPKLERFESDMKDLELVTETYLEELKLKFKEFSKSIGKETELQNADSVEFETAFNKFLAESNISNDAGKIHIEEIKIKLEEFNSVLTQMNNLMKSLEGNLKFVRESYEKTICEDNTFKTNFVNDVKSKFESSEGEAKKTREGFEKDIVNPYRNYYRTARKQLSEIATN